eukprot:TRINITY_DN3363_c0_g2_i2.p1 TRINITY_DN3363_c0_g2~~TRINITY_DN3363_c0_g2_i2.p1  ORF type:complete len:173 (+),score=30.36 TRINITY_DN3363_c0_g2_i2:33-521(+)
MAGCAPELVPPTSQLVLTPDHVYMLVHLQFEANISNMDAKLFKMIIHQAVRSMFGASAGASLCLELHLVSFDPANTTSILRVQRKHAVAFQGALTLCGEYDGKKCRLSVERITSFAPSIPTSRSFFTRFATQLNNNSTHATQTTTTTSAIHTPQSVAPTITT